MYALIVAIEQRIALTTATTANSSSVSSTCAVTTAAIVQHIDEQRHQLVSKA